MAVTLTFRKPEEYGICFSAIALAQHQLPVASWDLHVACLKALRSIGKPTTKLPNGTQLYDLDLPEDGTTFREVTLDKVELDHLLSCIEQPMWSAGALESVIETRSWLRLQKDQKPELKAVP